MDKEKQKSKAQKYEDISCPLELAKVHPSFMDYEACPDGDYDSDLFYWAVAAKWMLKRQAKDKK